VATSGGASRTILRNATERVLEKAVRRSIQEADEQSWPARSKESSIYDRRNRLGRDGLGNWVALDREGASGGLFVSREAARAFALVENGNREDAIEVIDKLELKLEIGAGGGGWGRNAAPPADGRD
jgi:hypothetical protein